MDYLQGNSPLPLYMAMQHCMKKTRFLLHVQHLVAKEGPKIFFVWQRLGVWTTRQGSAFLWRWFQPTSKNKATA